MKGAMMFTGICMVLCIVGGGWFGFSIGVEAERNTWLKAERAGQLQAFARAHRIERERQSSASR